MNEKLKKKSRMTCKKYCPVWNDIDKDCEIYGEHHFTPRTCPHYNIDISEKKMIARFNKCCLDAINRGTVNTVKAVKEFGMPERIEELVKQNTKLKELLKEWVQFETEENPNDFTVMSERMSELANKTKEVLQCGNIK